MDVMLILDRRMDKRKSFVFPKQYRNCFSRRINALVLRDQPIKTTIGMVMHDFHGLKTETFLSVEDITYFCLAFTEITKFLSLNVTSETCSETLPKIRF